MIIKEIGRYKLLSDITERTSISIGTLPKGFIFEVSQIDGLTHKIIGPCLKDWINWDIDAEKI